MNEEYAAVMFEVMVSSGIDRQPMSEYGDNHTMSEYGDNVSGN